MIKRLLFLLCIPMFSGAQSVYQVASIQSDQVKLVEKDFVYENEHLKVIYNLWEEGGRMRFLLYNKTEQPIYIDWTKSFIERNGFVTIYSQLLETLGNVPTDGAEYVYQKAGVQPLRRTARTNQIAQIPPHMYVAITDFLINHVQEYAHTAGKFYTYTKENSPLQVEHQLAYALNGTLTGTQVISHSFWAESIHAVNRADMSRIYGSRQYGQPNALYALRHQPYEPKPSYLRHRRNIGNRVLLGVLAVVLYTIRFAR